MKKTSILIFTSLLVFGWISIASADVLGYPIVEKQAKFYTIILGLIAFSITLVASSYLYFWLADGKIKISRPALSPDKEGFARHLAAAAQSAK